MNWCVFLTAITVAACGGVASDPDFAAAKRATIQTRSGNYIRSRCGGVAVSPHHIATIHHCHHSPEINYLTWGRYWDDALPERAALVDCVTSESPTHLDVDGVCVYHTERELAHWEPIRSGCSLAIFVGHGDTHMWRSAGPYWVVWGGSPRLEDARVIPGDSGGGVFCDDGGAIGVLADTHGGFYSLESVSDIID